MKTVVNIYRYKDMAYGKEEGRFNVKYVCMPEDFSSSWQPCTKEAYDQAKYYGMPAKRSKPFAEKVLDQSRPVSGRIAG